MKEDMYCIKQDTINKLDNMISVMEKTFHCLLHVGLIRDAGTAVGQGRQ